MFEWLTEEIVAEEIKKNKYSSASADRRASFSPFVVSVDEVLGGEASVF